MKKVIFLLVTIFLLLNFNSSYANYIEENSIREQYIIMEEDYADFLKSLSWNKSPSWDFDSWNFLSSFMKRPLGLW